MKFIFFMFRIFETTRYNLINKVWWIRAAQWTPTDLYHNNFYELRCFIGHIWSGTLWTGKWFGVISFEAPFLWRHLRWLSIKSSKDFPQSIKFIQQIEAKAPGSADRWHHLDKNVIVRLLMFAKHSIQYGKTFTTSKTYWCLNVSTKGCGVGSVPRVWVTESHQERKS